MQPYKIHMLDLNWLPKTKIFFVTITDLTGNIACWKMALNSPFEYQSRKNFSCCMQLWQDNNQGHLIEWLCPCDKKACKYWRKQGNFAFTNLSTCSCCWDQMPWRGLFLTEVSSAKMRIVGNNKKKNLMQWHLYLGTNKVRSTDSQGIKFGLTWSSMFMVPFPCTPSCHLTGSIASFWSQVPAAHLLKKTIELLGDA